jgi:hypothetical protein
MQGEIFFMIFFLGTKVILITLNDNCKTRKSKIQQIKR